MRPTWARVGREDRYVSGFGGAKPVGGASQASLFEVYGGRERGRAPGGLL